MPLYRNEFSRHCGFQETAFLSNPGMVGAEFEMPSEDLKMKKLGIALIAAAGVGAPGGQWRAGVYLHQRGGRELLGAILARFDELDNGPDVHG